MINVNLSSLKSLGENDGSHFFGTPFMTKKLARTRFLKEELFVGQLNFSEVKPFDTDGVLPQTGMLYIFFDVYAKEYALFFAKDRPTFALDGYNKKFDNFRYDNALKLSLSNPSDEDEEKEDCVKILPPIPDKIQKALPNASDFVCLFNFSPKVLDDLGRPFIRSKEFSCILIKKKHLAKCKFQKILTINY